MKKEGVDSFDLDLGDEPERPLRLSLPGFIDEDEEVGLGDVLKRVTGAMGIRPCGGCERRAAALNRRIILSGKRGKQAT